MFVIKHVTSPNKLAFLSRNLCLSRINTKNCKDICKDRSRLKTELENKDGKQCGKDNEPKSNNLSKDQCNQRSSSKPATAIPSYCKNAQQKSNQNVQEIKQKLDKVQCEAETPRAVEVCRQGKSKSSEAKQEGESTNPPEQTTSTNKKKNTSFLYIIGLALVSALAYIIFTHGEDKEKPQDTEESPTKEDN